MFTSYKMTTLYFHKLWFQHLAIIKPFLINHIAIQVIVKDLHRIIFLVIDERFSEQPVVQPEAKWCVKQLVIASPSGDELEIKCSNLAVVVELLRKMSM